MYLKVYCILAHKNPSQVKELVELLDDGKSLFFIHVDKKVNKSQFENIIKGKKKQFIKKRISCTWGKYSLVQATLNTMKEVQDFMDTNFKKIKYHFIMLSGEDLPLKSNVFIHDFLEDRIETSFINYWELPSKQWWGGGLFRFENLYFFEHKKHPKLNYWVNKIIKKLNLNFILPINRLKKYFPDFKIYGASQWMILNQDMVQFILEKSSINKKKSSIFKYVLAPDELYFASLILNQDIQKQFLITNLETHLVRFRGTEPSPKYLEIEDLNINLKDFLFARKFDSSINQTTIDNVIKTITE